MFGVAKRALDLARERLREHARVEPAGVLHACVRVDRVDVEPGDGLRQIGGTAVPQTAGDAVANGLERAAAAWRDRRTTGCLCLDCRDPELFGAGDDQCTAALEQAGGIRVADASG